MRIPYAVPEVKTSTSAWKVDAPPGEAIWADIAVDEGTWISLDVSPDGKTIVFDLLGDLYVMPIAGGAAKAITSGMAWDMQPTFSPDGEAIAFISDRGGSANVWVVKTDGSDPKKISSESEMASPAWTPDGQFVAARKHKTTQRSLGAGEIWLYHRTGGGGLMMTKRDNDQKDVGEPAFSPDGAYMYFSKDITPGKYFEYNKDPHAGIYAVMRMERASGRIERYFGGWGGAVAPRPAPDGKTIAYVRRVGPKTALYLYDVASGAETVLYDALDRDMQETWAIHGVYPRFAWTPDGSSLVFWAGGKIRRIDVASKKVTDVPFTVKDRREMRKALRFAVDVHPKKFETKMLRDVVLSPDGKRAAYVALGRIWVQSLPDGKPRRLTRGDGPFEQHPAFSRDSRQIVFTTWSDEDLGAVHLVPAGGGSPRKLTKMPGHFASPELSPDGKTVVFQKVGGHPTRSRLYTSEPGIYTVPRTGGTPKLVRRGGGNPHFAAENARVYFSSQEGQGEGLKFTLKSIELDGSDERLHVKSSLAAELRVSDDGRFVAFRENYNAYLAPFPRTGRPLDLSAKSKALPVVKVSADSGGYLRFTGGGKRLSWAMGPQLFVRNVDDAFAPKPPAIEPVKLGVEVASDMPSGSLVLRGARIVTMRGDEILDGGEIRIEGNRITGVGPKGSLEVPKGAKVVDVSGMTIVPGFVDVHHHGPQAGQGLFPRRNWSLYALLTFGVTTVHDPSHHTPTIFSAAELQRAGEIVGPRIFSTGTILYGASYPFKARVANLADAKSHLVRMKAVGAISVKSYRQPKRTQRQQIVTAARELGMMVVPEGGSVFQDNLNMVVDGHTGVEHAIPVAAVYDDVVQLWRASKVGYTPTTVVGYGGWWGENYWYAQSDVYAHPRLSKYVPPYVLEPRSRRRIIVSDDDLNHIEIAKHTTKLLNAGVGVQVGAHGQREGLAVHWEMWMMVQGGMTPHQALRVGTKLGAEYLGLDGDVGSIDIDKLADLAIIEGDPTKDIRLSEKVKYVVQNGRLYDAATMNQLHPEKVERKPFFWE